MRKVTEKEINYFRTALAMCGLGVSNQSAELILRCFHESKRMGGSFDLKTACEIQVEVDEKYKGVKPPPHITIEDMDKFYDKAVEIFHEKKAEDELSTKTILYELKTLIEEKKNIFQ